jgi:hypothetical protein
MPFDLQYGTCPINMVTLSSGSLDGIVSSVASRLRTKYLCAALKWWLGYEKVLKQYIDCVVVNV